MAEVSKQTDKVLIVDDHSMMRLGLASLLAPEEDIEVVAEAESARDAMTEMARHQPNLVLADLRLKDGNGLELIKDALIQWPEMRFLVVSMHDERIYAARVLHAGGRGYVMKEAAPDKLLVAIRMVLDGKIYVSDEVAQILISPRGNDRSAFEILTDRELEVLELIGMALSTRKIAARLKIGIKTVESHCANIKTKLKLADRNELVSYAVRWGVEQ